MQLQREGRDKGTSLHFAIAKLQAALALTQTYLMAQLVPDIQLPPPAAAPATVSSWTRAWYCRVRFGGPPTRVVPVRTGPKPQVGFVKKDDVCYLMT